MIFFRSVSTKALIPAINIVKVEINKREALNIKNLDKRG